MRFYFTHLCALASAVEFPRCFDRYTRGNSAAMMHIKNTEWNSALLAAWRNNALMSRRRSDYGGFTLVIVISQRTRVATRVWEKIFIASLSLSLSLFLVPAEQNTRRLLYIIPLHGTCTRVEDFQLQDRTCLITGIKVIATLYTLNTGRFAQAPSLETCFWRTGYEHFPWPRYYSRLYRVEQSNGCSVFEFSVLDLYACN